MKRILWVVFGLATLAVLYYLTIRPFEFEVTMKARTVPGDVIGTIRIWSRSLPDAHVVEVDSFRSLKQNIALNGSNYVYHWRFATTNDSLTKINVQISQPGRRFLNKLLIPFTDQQIEEDAAAITRQFYSVLKSHLAITRVEIVGEAELDSTFCVCSSLKTAQIEKANGMMRDYTMLTSFVDRFDLKPDGAPIVKVREWDHSAGQLEFDFCFPIVPTDSLPDTASLTYRRFGRKRALKAEYRGNYITSDRAWYELIHYAQTRGLRVSGLPIEYFHNNPNTGMNEVEWKAEVFLPISD